MPAYFSSGLDLSVDIVKEPPRALRNVIGWSGEISREEAEAKLKDRPKGTFLIRWSSRVLSFVVSIQTGMGFKHISGITISSRGRVSVETSQNVTNFFDDFLEYLERLKALGEVTAPISV